MLGVPVAGLGALCAELASRLPALGLQDTPIVWTCKGFEAGTARLPHEIVREALPQANAACCPDRPSRAKSRRACRWR